MKKLLLIIQVLCIHFSQAANFHSIIVADVEDWSIGTTVQKDLDSMRKLLHEISLNSEMEMQEKTFQKDDFCPEKISNYLDTLELGEDDSIIFYYSGHGYRIKEKETQWPVLYFGDKGLDVYKVHEKIKAKKPRLSIVLSDCCNSFISSASAPPFGKTLNNNNNKASNYKKLFAKSRGHLLMSSSSIGEYSYCDPLSGGWFTNSFIVSLEKYAEEKDPLEWKVLIDAVVSHLANFVKEKSSEEGDEDSIKQHPIYDLDIKSSTAA